MPKFPQNSCEETARIVKMILGLEEIACVYVSPELVARHSWNHDRNLGLYVDLTQDQFYIGIPEIVIIPETTDILRFNRVYTEMQHSYKFSFEKDLARRFRRK